MAILVALPLFAITLTGCEETEGAPETTQPARLVAPIVTTSPVVSEAPPEPAAAEPSPSPEPTTSAPSPEPEPVAVPEPEPEPAALVAPVPEAAPALDPDFGTCKKAVAAGYGNYVRGQDPEYDWYRDSDKDGIVCEF